MPVNSNISGAGSRLEIEQLSIEVWREGSWKTAVRDVSFTVEPGERVAIVGESGSGKSLTAQSIIGLLPDGARVAGGRILFDGVDLTTVSEDTLRSIRGRDIGYVFQNPMSSLDPVMRVGRQVEETVRAHETVTRQQRTERAVRMLEQVGIENPEQRIRDYPHQFSGGMQQRAMIAAALVSGPSLLIADEPTTALDVTVQAKILRLMRSLSEENRLSLLMITHDLAVAAQIAERVIVMYAGRVLEDAPIATIVGEPHHPYTRALLELVPDLSDAVSLPQPIPGHAVPGWEAGAACPFADRCPHAIDACRTTPWRLASVSVEPDAVHPGDALGHDHWSACIRPLRDRQLESAAV